MLAHRETPNIITTDEFTPVGAMFGRKNKTLLDSLRPYIMTTTEWNTKMEKWYLIPIVRKRSEYMELSYAVERKLSMNSELVI